MGPNVQVGDVVLVMTNSTTERPAMVYSCTGSVVSVNVFTNTGAVVREGVKYDPKGREGHWRTREDAKNG
jgi:hypothetical protein